MIGKAIAGVVLLVALVPVLFTAAGVAILGGFDGGTEAAENGTVEALAAAYRLPADPTALAEAVLNHPRIGLRASAAGDVRAGRVDVRILAVLLVIATEHDLAAVGPFVTGHSYYVAGTDRPSNHAFGRGVDLPVVDGSAVSPTNTGARAVVDLALALPPDLRPDEIGCPWPDLARLPGVFTDAAHYDHLHLGFER